MANSGRPVFSDSKGCGCGFLSNFCTRSPSSRQASGIATFCLHQVRPATSRIFVVRQHHDHHSVNIRASNEHNSVFIGIQLIAVDADLSLPSASLHLCWPMNQSYQTKLPGVKVATVGSRFIAVIFNDRKHGGYYGARNSSLAAGRADPDHYFARVDLALTRGIERSWQR